MSRVQFRLTTLLAMMLAAGVMVGVNATPQTFSRLGFVQSEDERGVLVRSVPEDNTAFGWPVAFYCRRDSTDYHYRVWNLAAIMPDAMIALAVVALIAGASEWFVRHRERNKT